VVTGRPQAQVRRIMVPQYADDVPSGDRA
jgi:hypothetical protein